MSEKAPFFSHDANARHNEKTLALRVKYGWEGYGLFWALIERLRESKDYTSVKDYNLIAFDLRTSADKIKSIVNDFGLFAFTDDGKCFYSERLNETMEIKNTKSNQAREKANKRWGKTNNTTPTQEQEECSSNATAIQQQCSSNASKVKESKVNVLLEKEPKYNNNKGAGEIENQEPVNNEGETLSKSCGKKFSQKFTPPTPEEVQEYCNERQNNIDGQGFCDYYQSNGWMVGKNKMKDWKAAVRTWERNNKNNNGKQSISTNTRATTGKSGKISAHQLLARAVNQQPTRDDESGNITIEVEALQQSRSR